MLGMLDECEVEVEFECINEFKVSVVFWLGLVFNDGCVDVVFIVWCLVVLVELVVVVVIVLVECELVV